MKATIISDKDFQTDLFRNLFEKIIVYFDSKGIETKTISIGRNDLAFCMGCFGCWVKKPGECVMNDMMSQINRNFINSDVVVYLSPVIFGQFSANIKNAIDRWLPNILPFFIKRPDDSTMHPSRYKQYPYVIVVGYGEDISDEDAQLFIDITKKHRNNTEVLIYKGDDEDISQELDKITLRKAGGYL
ncbi:MAG: flavodoxin family protein [Spirochaetes bacterium]|nr:flavodoxin family protein [Spirochaetota bacterium]